MPIAADRWPSQTLTTMALAAARHELAREGPRTGACASFVKKCLAPDLPARKILTRAAAIPQKRPFFCLVRTSAAFFRKLALEPLGFAFGRTPRPARASTRAPTLFVPLHLRAVRWRGPHFATPPRFATLLPPLCSRDAPRTEQYGNAPVRAAPCTCGCFATATNKPKTRLQPSQFAPLCPKVRVMTHLV